jgi:hypothetical protein
MKGKMFYVDIFLLKRKNNKNMKKRLVVFDLWKYQ